MKIGCMLGMAGKGLCTIDEYIAEAQQAETLGFDQVWMGQVFSTDAISMMTLLGRETQKIRLGTAVTPSYPRHPTSLALQALTASAASDNRFDLGLGLSHKIVIEDMYGFSYDKPTRHMSEYLQVLKPLLASEQCNFSGEQYRVNAKMAVPGASRVPLLLAALGPKMLELAGRYSDGTITWMTGAQTLASHIVPTITAAASDAGKAPPRIIAGLPVVLTDKPDEVREKIAEQLVIYGQLPSYKAMLEKEGASTPADIALVGNEAELRRQIQSLRDAGVTDLNSAVMSFEDGLFERTVDFLATQLTTAAGK